MAAAIPTAILACAPRSWPPRPRTCPPTTSSAPSSAAPASLPGATYEEFTLEGYGPGGVAILAEINTDNRNRTVSEIRHVFGKNNGNMAEAGAVSWMFHKKGDIVIPKGRRQGRRPDGASCSRPGGEDLRDDGDNWEILTEPSAYEAVLEAVKKAGITPSSSERLHDSAKLHQARRHGGHPDDPPARSARKNRTTCRTCTPTSTSIRSCWKKSQAN